MRDDFNSSCELISTVEKAVKGVLAVIETKREVFCTLLSDVHTVRTAAGTSGVAYEIKLKLPDVTEYDNEKFCEFNGNRYEVTRTYRDGEMIELTCQRGVR